MSAQLLPYLPLSSIVGLAAGLAYDVHLALQNWGGIIPGPAKTSQDYEPVVYVTAASLLLYYIFLFYQSMTAFVEFNKARKAYREKKTEVKPALAGIKYGSDNLNMLAANRNVGNYQEQLAPFLISLYLYATFVSVHGAVKFGWAWIFFRSYYISVFKRGPPLLFLSTIPAYWCVWMMIGGTIYRLSVK